jgi:hypothetical protein
MQINERIDGLVKWGHALSALLEDYESPAGQESGPLQPVLAQAYQLNKWFLPASSLRSLKAISTCLERSSLNNWASAYPALRSEPAPLRVGIVMAGNIPAVGFHDLLSVLLSGHRAYVRYSSDDNVLLPFLLHLLRSVEPRFAEMIAEVPKISGVDAVIATGSNNTARYFDYYFSAIPHIIRRNRHAVAVLSGNETEEELKALGDDVFAYFGLGCRNVSKLYVPEGYSFDRFFPAMEHFSDLMQHNKYMNNYDYHRALFLLNSQAFLTNNFLILREHTDIHTPVAVLHYERYRSHEALSSVLAAHQDEIQCIMGHDHLPFGTAQQPGLTDYADGVDTLRFLLDLPAQVK